MGSVITGHEISVYQALFPFDVARAVPIMAPLDGRFSCVMPLWRNW